MTEPGDQTAAAGGGPGRGRLRASHADREQVVDALKAAFVQGRLPKDEFDTRVGQAFAARTYAELAALTAETAVSRPACSQPVGSQPPHRRRPRGHRYAMGYAGH